MTKEIVVIAVSYMPDTNRHITSSQMPGHTPIGFSHTEHRDSHTLSQQAGTQFLSLSHFLSLSLSLYVEWCDKAPAKKPQMVIAAAIKNIITITLSFFLSLFFFLACLYLSLFAHSVLFSCVALHFGSCVSMRGRFTRMADKKKGPSSSEKRAATAAAATPVEDKPSDQEKT